MDATEASVTSDPETPTAASDFSSVLRGRVREGPKRREPFDGRAPSPALPGVPGEGEERGGADIAVGETSNLNPPSSHFTSSPAEAITQDDISDESRNEELDQVCEDPELDHEPEPVLTGATWTIPMLCAGIGLIACCIIIPQADSNRRLAYEKQMLQADLESVERQVTVNGEFLNRVVDDPALSERLAQRQLKRVRKGQRVLQLKEDQPEMSPFQITNIAPPARRRRISRWAALSPASVMTRGLDFILMGVALTMIAGGLVLGSGARQPRS